jgi:hypothetical protein
MHAERRTMDLSWADVAEPLVAGLAGTAGVYLVEEALRALRRSGRCPDRWARDRPADSLIGARRPVFRSRRGR